MMRYQVIDDFLKARECNKLIKLARPRLEPSTGWDVESGTSKRSDYRISDQTFFLVGGGTPEEGPLIRSIEDRIAKLTDIPVENGEGLQVLRYGVGGHYKPHWDCFDSRYPGNESILERGGQRVATVMLYLNNVPKGGETRFPRVPNERGTDSLMIAPKRGRALLWWNVLPPDGKNSSSTPDMDTLHEGTDVIEGEKWIATKWIREKKFW